MIEGIIKSTPMQIFFALVLFFLPSASGYTSSEVIKGDRSTVFVSIEREDINNEIMYNSTLEVYKDGNVVNHIYITNDKNSDCLIQIEDTLNLILFDNSHIKSYAKSVWLRHLAEESDWVLNPYFRLWELNENVDTLYKLDIPDSLFYDVDLFDSETLAYKIDIKSKTGEVTHKRFDEYDTIVTNANFSWYTSDDYYEDTIRDRYNRVHKTLYPNYDSLLSVDLWIGENFGSHIPITGLYGVNREYKPAMGIKNILNIGFRSCPPCIQMKPLLDSLHKSGTYNVQYLSIDRPTKDIMDYDQAYYDNYDFSFDFGYVEPELLANRLLQHPPMPFTLFMDENGKVQSVIVGFDKERLYKQFSE